MKSHARAGNVSSESELRLLWAAFNRLPLHIALEVYRHLSSQEQEDLQDVLFGKVVAWRAAVRRGRITSDQVETIGRLLHDHAKATLASQSASL